jgi:hypothetical protein
MIRIGSSLLLVVEHEHARPPRQQGLRARYDSDVDGGQREPWIRADLAADVDKLASRVTQEADTRPGPHARDHPAVETARELERPGVAGRP